jgi:hypothetical protein
MSLLIIFTVWIVAILICLLWPNYQKWINLSKEVKERLELTLAIIGIILILLFLLAILYFAIFA